MTQKDVMKELEHLVSVQKENEDLEEKARRIGFQISEYQYQAKHLQNLIGKERLELAEYISMKMAKLEALKEMAKSVEENRLALEKDLENMGSENKKESSTTPLEKAL